MADNEIPLYKDQEGRLLLLEIPPSFVCFCLGSFCLRHVPPLLLAPHIVIDNNGRVSLEARMRMIVNCLPEYLLT